MYRDCIQSRCSHASHRAHLACNLEDGRPSGDGVVGDRLVAGSQDDVALSTHALGNGDRVGAAGGGGGHKDGASDGDEGAVELGVGAVGGDKVGTWSSEGDGCAGGDGASGADCELGEGLDGQGRVGARARDDEGCGEGVDFVKVERVIEWLREGRLPEGGADVRAVSGLDGQYGAGIGEVGLAHDGGGSTEVGADTDTLKDRCKSDEALGVAHTEVVGAFRDGCGSSSLQGRGEEGNMRRLIA